MLQQVLAMVLQNVGFKIKLLALIKTKEYKCLLERSMKTKKCGLRKPYNYNYVSAPALGNNIQMKSQ